MKTAIARLSFSYLVLLLFPSTSAFLEAQKISCPPDKRKFFPLRSVYVSNDRRLEFTSTVSANLVKEIRNKNGARERLVVVYTYEYVFINRSNSWISFYFINAETSSFQLVLKPGEERREILITERTPEVFSVNVAINIQVNEKWSMDGVAILLMYFPASISRLQSKTACIFWRPPKNASSFLVNSRQKRSPINFLFLAKALL